MRRLLAVLLMLVPHAGLAPEPAAAAGPGQYGAAEWFPLRGEHQVGCTNGNQGCGGYHGYWALDLPAGRGEAVHAAGAGRVIRAVKDQGGNCPGQVTSAACPNGSKGNSVTVDHGGGVTTLYLHFSTVSVSVDDWVDASTVLGGAGDSGPSTPGFHHLHFEKRLNGTRVDPVGLKACLGNRLTSYPGEWGKGSWSQVPAFGPLRPRSDGVGCAVSWPPPDGTFVNDGGTIYRVAGGAPLWVSSWGAVGGPQPYVDVTPAQLASLRQYPADGTAVHDGVSGAGYVFAGGAPLYVASWASVGSPAFVAVDGYPLGNDGPAPLGHVRRYPADGTAVHNGAPGALHGAGYVFAGGAPLYVASWASVGNPQSTTVDQYALDNAGGEAHLDHARRYPADGTYTVRQGGAVSRFAGGAPIEISDWSHVGGPHPATLVDGYAFVNAGPDAPLDHVRRLPADGTVARGRPSGRAWVFTAGCRLATSRAGGVDVSDSGLAALVRCLRVTTASVPAGRVRRAYRATLTASGGTRPYTWSLASGRLPAGVTLSRSGVLAGIPSRAGAVRFTVRVSDGTRVATKGYRLEVRKG